MLRVELEIVELGRRATLDLESGDRLLDACDDELVPVRVGCRSANCGTCLVEAVAGGGLLLPSSPREQDLLDRIAGPGTSRLLCQILAGAIPGTVRLRTKEPKRCL